MKKIYFFLSAACVAMTASAVQKEMAVAPSSPVKAKIAKAVKSEAGVEMAKAHFSSDAKASQMGTRAGESAVAFFRPADNVMSFSMSPAGSYYSLLGFSSSYGTVDFINYSAGMNSYKWVYSELNDYVVEGEERVWNEKTATSLDLSIKSGIGSFPAPYLYGTPAAGGNEIEASTEIRHIYCGGGADYWLNNPDADEMDACGVTFYQNTGLVNGRSNGSTCNPNSYSPNQDGFDENGVCTYGNSAWKSTLESAWFRGAEVTDIKFNNFTVVQPKPVSTYFMTRGWIWMQVGAKAATMLTSYIYPIDEEGMLAEMPIAVGYASIPNGGTEMVVFYYVPLNEDGDEIEDVVYIDSAVAITIEGFVGNDAITEVTPVCGYYPFNYNDYSAGNYDVCKTEDLYLNFDVTANDQVYKDCLVYNLGLYGFGTDPNMCTSLAYAQFATDATYAYIHSVDGVYEVNIPAAGGQVETEVEALYYNIQAGLEEGWYVLDAPEWLSVEVSSFDPMTGNTTLTIAAAASEEGRSGYVTIEGLGATYSLNVVQGDGGNAVNVVVADKNAEYYDLQGRRVANPDKGIYVKKTGNKAEKVVF